MEILEEPVFTIHRDGNGIELHSLVMKGITISSIKYYQNINGRVLLTNQTTDPNFRQQGHLRNLQKMSWESLRASGIGGFWAHVPDVFTLTLKNGHYTSSPNNNSVLGGYPSLKTLLYPLTVSGEYYDSKISEIKFYRRDNDIYSIPHDTELYEVGISLDVDLTSISEVPKNWEGIHNQIVIALMSIDRE